MALRAFFFSVAHFHKELTVRQSSQRVVISHETHGFFGAELLSDVPGNPPVASDGAIGTMGRLAVDLDKDIAAIFATHHAPPQPDCITTKGFVLHGIEEPISFILAGQHLARGLPDELFRLELQNALNLRTDIGEAKGIVCLPENVPVVFHQRPEPLLIVAQLLQGQIPSAFARPLVRILPSDAALCPEQSHRSMFHHHDRVDI